MKQLLADALHVFIILMMVVFVIGGILAISGTFDHWTERYRLKQRRKRLIRDKYQFKNMGNLRTNSTPYISSRPDKETTTLDKTLI